MSVGRQRCCPSKWCPGPGPPPNAERSLWVWEGLHGSDDHARLLGLLHQNTRGGQQQESWCQNQLRKIQSPAFTGPGPLQWVDLTTYRTRWAILTQRRGSVPERQWSCSEFTMKFLFAQMEEWSCGFMLWLRLGSSWFSSLLHWHSCSGTYPSVAFRGSADDSKIIQWWFFPFCSAPSKPSKTTSPAPQKPLTLAYDGDMDMWTDSHTSETWWGH